MTWGWWGPVGITRRTMGASQQARAPGGLHAPCSDPTPTACRLTSVERAASAEETDIDAVELPLPGADILDFNRGVTDLDAVGKEASAYADAKVCGSLPLALGAQHGPGPAALDWRGGIVQHSLAPIASKASAAAGLPFGSGPRALLESAGLGLGYVQPHGKCLGHS